VKENRECVCRALASVRPTFAVDSWPEWNVYRRKFSKAIAFDSLSSFAFDDPFGSLRFIRSRQPGAWNGDLAGSESVARTYDNVTVGLVHHSLPDRSVTRSHGADWQRGVSRLI